MASTELETETETATATTTTTYTALPPPPSRTRTRTRQPSLHDLMSDADATPRASPTERRKSDFEIYRDGHKGAAAATSAARTSPGTQLHRERRMREKELRALEDEYLSGRRAGRGGSGGRGRGRGTSVIEEVTEETDDEEVTDEEEDAPHHHPRQPTKTKPSATSILSHGRPSPDLTPLPAPPLSRLHKRFATGTTPSPATAPPRRRTSKLSPTPVLAPAPADPDVSPLEHMRHLRAQFEALRPRSQSPSQSPSPSPSPTSTPTPPPAANPTSKPKRRTRTSPSSSKPTTTADLLAHYTFTLSHLPALTHHSRTATLTLTPTTPSSPGHLTLNLRPTTTLRGGSHTTYTIPPHGLPITVTTASPSPTSAPITAAYALAELPLKHLPALRYAKSFVSVVQRATVVGRVEVRERCGGGRVWTGRRWADGRFEAVRGGGGGGEGEEVVVRIEGVRGEEVGVWVGGRRVKDVGSVRWEKVVDRAQRMWSACWRVLEEEGGGGVGVLEEASTSAATATPPPPPVKARSQQPPAPPAAAAAHSKHIPFPIDASTTFVPTIGWCRRDAHTGWWSMLFVDGVRLEIDPVSGDAVWTDKLSGDGGGGGEGERRVLKGGMGMREVRERVGRFVERGL